MTRSRFLERLAKRWRHPKYPTAEALTSLFFGTKAGIALSAELPIWTRRVRRVNAGTFASVPGLKILLRLPYDKAAKELGFTRKEYNSALAHELGHMRDWPTVLVASTTPSLAGAGLTIGAHRLLGIHPYLAAPVALGISNTFVRNPLMYLAEMHADKAATKRYGKYYISALKKIKKMSREQRINESLKSGKLTGIKRTKNKIYKKLYSNPTLSILIDPHTSIGNRVRRAQNWMKNWGMS